MTFSEVAVPVLLACLALADGAFAGFRAGAGRNARIRKKAYNLRGARRGMAMSGAGLAATAAVLLPGLASRGLRYSDLTDAGTRMLMVLVPYAVVVLASLAAYVLLPVRESTFVILVGLGPLTLARPFVVAAAVVAAGADAHDWIVWAGAVVAAAGVLMVEPCAHRRWYQEPL